MGTGAATAVVQSVKFIDFKSLEIGISHKFPKQVKTLSVRCVTKPNKTLNVETNRIFKDGVYMGTNSEGYYKFIGHKIMENGNRKGFKNKRKYHFLLKE